MSNAFTAPHFQSHEAAREWLEGQRWPEGPICPHCGVVGHSYETAKQGVYRCAESVCRKDFSVTMNTVMERSHIPLNKWLMAFFLMASSKKGISAHQLHRSLAVSYKAAWFMAHRIREAMNGGSAPLGGPDGSGIVEIDETYFGPTAEAKVSKQRKGRPYNPRGSRGPANKRAIVALVERGGSLRSFHVANADKATVNSIIAANVRPEARVFTDESRLYSDVEGTFADHQTVRHSAKEYARGEVHTNTIEGSFSIFKRGMKGVYQHCAEKHLHRYLAEFDFRYNHRVGLGHSDIDRTKAAIKGADGKRLTFHQTH